MGIYIYIYIWAHVVFTRQNQTESLQFWCCMPSVYCQRAEAKMPQVKYELGPVKCPVPV